MQIYLGLAWTIIPGWHETCPMQTQRIVLFSFPAREAIPSLTKTSEEKSNAQDEEHQ